MIRAECQSAWMSKITTNNGLTRSCTGCFVTTVGIKGKWLVFRFVHRFCRCRLVLPSTQPAWLPGISARRQSTQHALRRTYWRRRSATDTFISGDVSWHRRVKMPRCRTSLTSGRNGSWWYQRQPTAVYVCTVCSVVVFTFLYVSEP